MELNRNALIWLVLLLAVSGQRSLGQDIHFLLVADTNDASLGRCCSITVQRVSETLRYLIPQQRYTLRTLESKRGDYSSAESVLRAIRDVQVPRGDTFVFFYHGHGGSSGDRHFLHMPDNRPLYSRDLKETIQAKACRLSIIMTCSCNVPVRGVGEAAQAAEGWDVTTQGMAPVMEELFLNHTGLYHTNSSWPKQNPGPTRKSGPGSSIRSAVTAPPALRLVRRGGAWTECWIGVSKLASRWSKKAAGSDRRTSEINRHNTPFTGDRCRKP